MGHMMTLDSDFLFENLCNKSGVMTSDSYHPLYRGISVG